MRQNVPARRLESSTAAMKIAQMSCGIVEMMKIEKVFWTAFQNWSWPRIATKLSTPTKSP